jgi:protein-S-isoprenylcysteine O-methyltransferase Ste14
VRNIRYFVEMFARWAIVTLFISLLLFGAAGTTGVSSIRRYAVTFSALLIVTMLSVDPGLAQERSRIFGRAATQGRLGAGLSFLATLGCAGTDVGRLHWLHSVPLEMQLGSLLLFVAATSLQMWAMIVNPFFSPDIRLQPERGHCLISRGPYRLLRHPGYLAMLISVPASALAIGSWLALVSAATFCLVILKRVRAEEEFLQNNLAGYREYMSQVRGQLFPRVAFRRRPLRHAGASTCASDACDRRWP